MTTTLQIVVSREHDSPLLLGTLMPSRPDDDGQVVRYYDSSPEEGEHVAPYDCVDVIAVEVSEPVVRDPGAWAAVAKAGR